MNHHRALPPAALGALLLAAGGPSLAAAIHTADRYAWGESLGWIDHRDGHGAVQVYADHLEGFAWAENIGWIKLGSHTGGGAHRYANGAADDWGVNRAADGALSGYAWSESGGWIDFAPLGGGVVVDPATGGFAGYAWGENLGWIKLAGDAPAYRVALARRSLLATSGGNGTAGGGGDYPPFAPVQLAATPAAGYALVGWAPAPCAPALAMPDADLTCTASFGADADGDTVADAGEARIFVRASAAPGGDGSDWDHAYAKLADALRVAATGDDLWVAQGVYFPDEDEGGYLTPDDPAHSFEIPAGVQVWGGFAGAETALEQRDGGLRRSVLSGDIGQDDSDPDGNRLIDSALDIRGANSTHVVTTQDASVPPRVDGLFVTAGDAAGSGEEGSGGGWLSRNASPQLSRLHFLGNRASESGGGFHAAGGDPELASSAFTGNQAPVGSALSASGGTLTLANVTVAGNAGAPLLIDAGALTLSNGVVWGNAGAPLTLVSGAIAEIGHSIVQGAGWSGAGWVGPGSDGGGNRDADPRLLGPAHGDVRIAAASSAALNAGDSASAVGATDLAGQPRIQDSAVEMGALEQHPIVPSASAVLSGSAASDILATQTANLGVSAGSGDDLVISARGRQVITLGAGRDTLVWSFFPDSDVVNDFALGEDRLDLRPVLQTIGYAGSNPLGSGHVQCASGSGGVLMSLDRDGKARAVYAAVGYALVKGPGLTPAGLCQAANLLY